MAMRRVLIPELRCDKLDPVFFGFIVLSLRSPYRLLI